MSRRRPSVVNVPPKRVEVSFEVHDSSGHWKPGWQAPSGYRPGNGRAQQVRVWSEGTSCGREPGTKTAMMERTLSDAELPEFGAPPVVEVVLGVQFRPIFGLRPVELAGLRERWRSDYPLVQEQPPLPTQIESPRVRSPQVQVVVGPALQSRIWFLNEAQTELVQLQHDRLTVNWRQTRSNLAYPRYPHVRGCSADLETSGARHRSTASGLLGRQAEVTYINAIELDDDQLGRLDRVLRNWRPPTSNHLGEPEQVRAALVFPIADTGRPPVRMYVTVDPAQRPDGRPVQFLTITVRGAPTEESLEGALQFMDDAHGHVVRSFAELTPEPMHAVWERQR